MKRLTILLTLTIFTSLLDARTNDPKVIEELNKLKMECNKKHNAISCNFVGYIYDEADDICQDRFTAKDYYKKACDLKYQVGCDNYKLLDEMGY